MTDHPESPTTATIPTLTVTETYFATAPPQPTIPVFQQSDSRHQTETEASPPPMSNPDPWAQYYPDPSHPFYHQAPPNAFPPQYPFYRQSYATTPPPLFYPVQEPVGQDFIAGTVVGPGTAILCILVVAGVYWGLKNFDAVGGFGGISGTLKFKFPKPSKEDGRDEKQESSSSSSSSPSSSSSKKDDSTTAPTPSIPVISPAAFISLFAFALAATVMIQGPLGIGRAFDAPPPPSPFGALFSGGGGGGGLLNLLPVLLGAQAAVTDPRWQGWNDAQASGYDGVVPQAGGQGITTGKEGYSQWNWFANPLPPINGPFQGSDRGPRNLMLFGQHWTQADKLAFTSLPPVLQGLQFCRSSPSVCTTLLANADLGRLVRTLGPSLGLNVNGPEMSTAVNALAAALGQAPAAQPNPIPLIPKNGFLGSIQGMGSLENAFFPLLVGAIGLVVLFDYGT